MWRESMEPSRTKVKTKAKAKVKVKAKTKHKTKTKPKGKVKGRSTQRARKVAVNGKGKGKGKCKEKTTTATGGGAERNEQEPDVIVVQDPWATLRSMGRSSITAEEMAVLVEGEGKVIALREDIESAGGLEGAKVLRSETIERALRQHFRQKTPVGTHVTDGGENTSQDRY